MNIIYTLSDHLIDQLHQLYLREWWTKDRTLSETKQCVNGSQITIGILDNNLALAGFARVITDFTFKALIFDLIVDEKYRGQNIGQQLIDSIKSHDQLQNVKHFELYCNPEMVDFYSKYGFSEELGGLKLLRYVNT